MQKSGAEILVTELIRHGTTDVFGYPGGSILSVYDAINVGGTKLNCVTAVDERAAVFMADGYARVSGKIGVCMATSGPGATNLVTGIAAAFMDSVPMVIVTGNVALDVLGHDSFQEVDTTGVTMPITKYNIIVKRVEDLAAAVSEAFVLADSGRKGPVLIDIPSNVFDDKCEYAVSDYKVEPKRFDNTALVNAAEIINNAKRPLIYAGGGVITSDTSKLVLELAKKLNAPVGVSLMGIGAVPSDFVNYIGVGTSVNTLAKDVLLNCDVFISLGARFSNKATEKSLYNKSVKLVHLDIDNAEIGKIHYAEGAVCGDLKLTLPALLAKVKQKDDKWLNEVIALKSAVTETSTTPKQYIKCLNKHFGNNMTVTTDVGQHQLWVANYFNFDTPRRFLSSCGLGAMGFGLGAAIGAHFATDKPVLMITGDGSFNMNFNELLSVKEYGVPVIIAVMNNRSLGMIREAQRKSYHQRYFACDIAYDVDYTSLGRAFGIETYVANNPSELDKLLETLPKDKAAIIDCRVPKNEKSY